MTGSTDFDAPTKPAWVGVLVPVLLVLGSAGFFWWYSEQKNTETNGEEPHSPPVATSGKLVEGQTYYLFASEIELYPTDLEGKPWDGGDNGPDIAYRMLWQGNEVFSSDTKDDSLIADWSGLGLELKWSDLLGKKISPDSAIKAARVRMEEGGRILIEVEDVDLTDDDEAGQYEIS
ncbi:MAG: hypothetical protein VCA36_08815, partial [Opitutales bacterium]